MALRNVVQQQANGCVHWAFQNCRLDATYYDYDGLSNQVIAERKSPAWAANPLYPGSSDNPWNPTGEDRFVATYLYGPMGPISRTAEMGDSDVSNNQESYYLRDAMGGNVGLSYDDDNDPGTESKVSFNVYDSFGNQITPGSSSASGSFAWRGGEGSVTDLESHLVFMQSRHYDPTLGRFLQADSMTLAGFTPQAMNRYVYCANDGVNRTDPSGMFLQLLFGVVLYGLGVWLGIELAKFAGGGGAGPLMRFLGVMLGGLIGAVADRCALSMLTQLAWLLELAASGQISAEVFAAAWSGTLFGWLGIIFGLGVLSGFIIQYWFAEAGAPDNERFACRALIIPEGKVVKLREYGMRFALV